MHNFSSGSGADPEIGSRRHFQCPFLGAFLPSLDAKGVDSETHVNVPYHIVSYRIVSYCNWYVLRIEEASTHKSAKTHAGNVFMTHHLRSFEPKLMGFQDSPWNISRLVTLAAASVFEISCGKQTYIQTDKRRYGKTFRATAVDVWVMMQYNIQTRRKVLWESTTPRESEILGGFCR